MTTINSFIQKHIKNYDLCYVYYGLCTLWIFQQLFETIKEGVNACFKCQPLVPEITIDDNASDTSQAQVYL